MYILYDIMIDRQKERKIKEDMWGTRENEEDKYKEIKGQQYW
jgi:hypothetical protein